MSTETKNLIYNTIQEIQTKFDNVEIYHENNTLRRDFIYKIINIIKNLEKIENKYNCNFAVTITASCQNFLFVVHTKYNVFEFSIGYIKDKIFHKRTINPEISDVIFNYINK